MIIWITFLAPKILNNNLQLQVVVHVVDPVKMQIKQRNFINLPYNDVLDLKYDVHITHT